VTSRDDRTDDEGWWPLTWRFLLYLGLILAVVALLAYLVGCGGGQAQMTVRKDPASGWGFAGGIDLGWFRSTYNEHGLAGCADLPPVAGLDLPWFCWKVPGT